MLEQRLDIERLYRMDVHDGTLDAFSREQIGRRKRPRRRDPSRHQQRPASARTRLAHYNRLTNRKIELGAADDRVVSFGKADIDGSGPVERLVHETLHLVSVTYRYHRHVRQRAHDRDVFDRQMGWTQRRIDQSGAIADQTHRQVMKAEIDRHLLVAAAGDERRDRMDVGNEAFHLQSSRHADNMLLADPLHEGAAGHLRLHPLEDRRVEVGTDIGDPRIAPRQLEYFVDAGRAHQRTSSAPYICATRSRWMLDLWCQLASFSAKASPLPLTV